MHAESGHSVKWRYQALMATAVLTLAALSAGCGGSGDSTTASLTKAQYIKRGDAICTKAEQEQLAGVERFQRETHVEALGVGSSEEQLVKEVGIPPLRLETEKLADLPAPQGGETQVKAYVAALEEGMQAAEKEPGLLLEAGKSPFAEAEELASAYGFRVCGGA